MRIIGIALLCTAASSAYAAGDYWHPIDLNQPGALEALKAENPAQFEAATEVLRAAERMPCQGNEMNALETRFDLREMSCGILMLTSLPPKRHLTFKLGDTHFVANVTIKDTAPVTVQVKGAD